MDGLDLTTIDQIDQEIFNGSSMDSDDEDAMPLPDCIGIDSAVQDEDQEVRSKQDQHRHKRLKTRAESERELELQYLKNSNSIRKQILEKSINNDSRRDQSELDQSVAGPSKPQSHVMNIAEKAGMSGIDKDKINQIIHDASRGSLFYKKQAQRQEEIHKSIEKMLNKIREASPTQIAGAKMTSDRILGELKGQRVLNKIIVHFDLDMFFAAVEILDNPELANKPMAVGGDSMISTSNYVARKYGVRAAMPGFIAKKLCPDLILVKPNGAKYRKASSEVFAILEQYDPELAGMSLDEAYLDLTDCVKSSLQNSGVDPEEFYDGTLAHCWWNKANEIVSEIRAVIEEKTRLTCSAGIACNTMLAKIATDIKKPNGQFMILGYPDEIDKFVKTTPVGKVSGIGKVSQQFLNAMDINNCGDILEKRHILPLVFYEINVRFYLRVALGDGSTCIQSDEQRKSKSVERTFAPIKDTLMMLDKLDNICEELCNRYLRPYRIRGRTVTVKLKRNTFTVCTRSYSMLAPTNDKSVIYSTAKNLLLTEIENESEDISYRLLGVKISNLADETVATNQLTIDAMLRNKELGASSKEGDDVTDSALALDENDSSSESLVSGSQEPLPAAASAPKKSDSWMDEFQCPYCAKRFADFHNLETHVDLHKSFFARKSAESQQPNIPAKSSSFFKNKAATQQSKGSTQQQTTSKKAKASTQKQQTKITDYGTPKVSQNTTESEKRTTTKSTPDIRDLIVGTSQAPTVEAFQCPYCLHGFLSFDSLEKHVIFCTKNKN